MRDTVSVKDFGAVGDGVADDTEAIKAAVATGKAVYFPQPSAYYNVTSPVTINVPFIAGLYKVFRPQGTVSFGLQSVTEVYPEWWGAVPESDSGSFDSTAAIQAAIDSTTLLNASTAFNEGTTLRVPVKLSMGVYYITGLAVSHPVRLIGSGMKNTLIKSLSTSTNLVTITAVEPVEIYDLSFGVKDGLGPMTAGSFILFNPTTESNQYSKIVRCAFNNMSNGVHTISAMFWIIDSCYFNKYTGTAIVVGNALLPDGGDSNITNCTFNNGTGTAILQKSSGGLRITNNKFLGGDYSYFGEYSSGLANRTGQLIIANNSFDQCNHANISFTKVGDSVYSMPVIENNIIVVSPNCFGVNVNGYLAETFLHQMTIGGNTFYLRDGATAIHLASCDSVSIHPNHFYADGGTTTNGVIFSTSWPISNVLVHPQSFMYVSSPYTGAQDNVSFISGKPVVHAGSPVNAVTPKYIGEECLDTVNNKWYKAYGLAVNLWAALN
jgi:hypothetical protein